MEQNSSLQWLGSCDSPDVIGGTLALPPQASSAIDAAAALRLAALDREQVPKPVFDSLRLIRDSRARGLGRSARRAGAQVDVEGAHALFPAREERWIQREASERASERRGSAGV
jgi:hypothetical protein